MSSPSSSLPATIRALKTQPGGKLAVIDVPFASREDLQELGSDFVLTKTLAVGLNPTDWKHAFGPWLPPNAENVVGCDSVGTVIAVGRSVTHLVPGDRVGGFVFGTQSEVNGAYAEYVKMHQAVCFKIPESMSDVEGAALPIPHLTAVQALYMRLGLPYPSSPFPKGSTDAILVWGGSTSVGHHAIQLAKLSGLKVYTTASPANHPFLLSLGATACFDYSDPEVVSKIQAAAASDGNSIAYGVDGACERGSTDLLVDCLRKEGGKVVTTLPISDETKNRRKEVEVEFTLVYTLLGFALTFANALSLPAMPLDTDRSQFYVSTEAASILPKLTSQKLRKMPGGLEKIEEGLRIMEAGSYRAEKLVYSLKKE